MTRFYSLKVDGYVYIMILWLAIFAMVSVSDSKDDK